VGLHQQVSRSRHAIWRAVVALHRPVRREPARSALRLSLAGREEVSGGRAARRSVRAIARGVGRCPSAVCREVAADGGRERYRRCAAGRRVVRLMRRPKPAKLTACPRLREVVEGKPGLLRQYFPCRTGFKPVTQSDLDQVAAELNDRPRQTLKWQSPCQALDEALR
jgi:IS30 family transposase